MFDVGDIYPATVDVTDAAGAPVNPATVTFEFTLPDGTLVSPTPMNPSTGRYTHDLTINQPGLHKFRAVTTGPATAFTDVFSAADPAAPPIVGLAELKTHLNIPAASTGDDEELREFALSVTEVVEHIVGPVAPRSVVEVHDGGGDAIVLRQPPVLSVTSVAEGGTAVADYILSDAGVLYRVAGCWLPGRGKVTVTYKAGRSVVPRSIAQAAKELARINWRPQQGGNYSPFDGGASDELGQVRLGFFVPNRVVEMLTPHSQAGFA